MRLYSFLSIVLVTCCLNCFSQEVDSFTDQRDGKVYKTVKIGKQWVMAENFAFKPNEGKFRTLNKDQANVAKYGYLYDWTTAKTIAPDGWHLPSKLELRELSIFLGVDDEKVYSAIKENGSSGFNVLFGGFYEDDSFIMNGAKFWSSTACGPDLAWCFIVSDGGATLGSDDVGFGYSIRLFKDL